MRDSSLKRALVTGYFSALEVKAAFAGMFARPANGKPIDYEAYWQHRAAGTVQPRFQVIAPAIERDATLLDVGCGDGAMLEYIARTRGARGLGIDISRDAVVRARARGVDARTISAGELLEAGQRFDHVVLSEVIEHVADAEGFLRDAWALARRTLWVTFPNIAYFPHRMRLLSGKFPVQWVVFPGEHLRFWSVPDFDRWIAAAGLPGPSFMPSNGLTALRLHRVWPNLFANQIVARIDR
jgi:methionine biosynthesis protein MetW